MSEEENPVAAAFESADSQRFVENALEDKSGAAADLLNVYRVLTMDPRWQGVIALDRLGQRVVKRKPPPYSGGVVGDWIDTDDTRTAVWLAQQYRQHRISMQAVTGAVHMVAEDNAFHPVLEYLQGLEWDRVSRLDYWLGAYLRATSVGMPEDARRYVSAVGRMWLLSAVARVFEPGCKADSVLILEGPQEIGKSTALRILAGDWFLDTPINLGDKDAYQSVQGMWIVELAELDSLRKAESTRAKAFFSSQEDYYRPSYGRRAMKFPRQCIFAGTTNQHEYLRDETGNRRFWPVRCRGLDYEELERDRDQLLAETVVRYLAGEKWYLTKNDDDLRKIIQAQTEERLIADPWLDIIGDWLAEPEQQMPGREITRREVMENVLGIDINRMDERAMATRVGRCLHRLGLVKRERTGRAARRGERFYYQIPGDPQ